MLEQLGTIHPLLPPGVGLLALLAGAVIINLIVKQGAGAITISMTTRAK
jgi:hypothetical protein